MSVERMAAFATLGATVVGTIALIFAARQVRIADRQRRHQIDVQRHAQNLAFGQFLLQLDEAFLVHQRVHRRLRPGHRGAVGLAGDVGMWCGPGKGPVSLDDWADVEAYLGLFERIGVLVDRDLLDPKVVVRLYGYRLVNIWSNDLIRQQKLVEQRDGWKDFIELTTRLTYEGLRLDRRWLV